MLKKDRTLIILLGIGLIAAVPLLSFAVMNGPDNGVNPDWRPDGSGSAVAPAQNNGTQNTHNNGSNGTDVNSGASSTMNGADMNALQNPVQNQSGNNSALPRLQSNAADGLKTLRGSVDVTLTVTGVDAANGRLAVNGMWLDVNRGVDRLIARRPQLDSFNLPAQIPLALGLLKTGDTLRVRASLAQGALAIQNLQFDRPGTSLAETSLQTLFNQVGRMLDGMKLNF